MAAPGDQVKALWDYDASGPGELSCKTGDVMAVTENLGDWLSVIV
jgi:hypothetical protein